MLANQFEVYRCTVCYSSNFEVNALLDGEPMKLLKSSSGCYC